MHVSERRTVNVEHRTSKRKGPLSSLQRCVLDVQRSTLKPLLLWTLLLFQAGSFSFAADSAAVAPELLEKDTAYEVLGHLYRWYLDEVDIRQATDAANDTLWVRQTHPELDPGDQSLFGEVVLPVLGVTVSLKKADYPIEELNTRVTSDRFKIVRVSRSGVPENLETTHRPVVLSGTELRDYLFARRGSVTFPDDALIDRLRSAVREKVDGHLADTGRDVPSGDRTVHIAPLSPIANELWAFWEDGRMLVRFASDLDLANPYVWDHEELLGRIYDLDEQVVVSLQEAPGSNAYLTRDQVGRALYNCIVLGRRYVISPTDPAADTEKSD